MLSLFGHRFRPAFCAVALLFSFCAVESARAQLTPRQYAVEATAAIQTAPLATELTRLQQDLTGDGWTVIRKDVSRTATVASVKSLIKAEYDADRANVKAVFLFGHVPVPRSGDINPDGHDNHKGAWAADTYYADMDGAWTDSTVNDTSAERADNYNTPGDGRFDQSEIPSDLELAVGRVDLSN